MSIAEFSAPILTQEALQSSNAVIDHTLTFTSCFQNHTKVPSSLIVCQLAGALKYNRSGHVMAARKEWAVKTGHKPFDENTDSIIWGDANDATYIGRKIHSRDSLDVDGKPNVKQSADLISFFCHELKAFGQWIVDTIKEMPMAQSEHLQAYVFFTRVNGKKIPFGALIADTKRNIVAFTSGPEAKKQSAMLAICNYVSNEGDKDVCWAGSIVDGQVYVALPELSELLAEINIQAIVGYPTV